MLMPDSYKPRLIDKKLDSRLQSFGAVAIVGPRWVGKTTTGQAHANSYISLADSLNDFGNKQLAETDPHLVIKCEPYEYPRLIDEWQIVPQVWDAVRYACDNIDGYGHFILTGSSQHSYLRNGVYHSGTGRFTTMTLDTMTLYETGDSTGQLSLQDLFDGNIPNFRASTPDVEKLILYCIRGGWPKTMDITDPDRAIYTSKEYIDMIVSEDINSLPNTKHKKDPQKTEKFLETLSYHEGDLLNINEYTQTSGSLLPKALGRTAIQSYIDALRELFVIYKQPAYTFTTQLGGTKMLRTDKIRFSDPSLAVAARGLTAQKFLRNISELTRYFDNLCVHDLKIYAESIGGNIYHLLDERGNSVDAVIELSDGRLGLFKNIVGTINIEKAASTLTRFKTILEKAGKDVATCCVICGMSDSVQQRPDGVVVTPLTVLKP